MAWFLAGVGGVAFVAGCVAWARSSAVEGLLWWTIASVWFVGGLIRAGMGAGGGEVAKPRGEAGGMFSDAGYGVVRIGEILGRKG